MKLLIRNRETLAWPEVRMKLAFIYVLYVSEGVQFTTSDLFVYVHSLRHLIQDIIIGSGCLFRLHTDSAFFKVFLANDVLLVHTKISVSTFFHRSLYPDRVPNLCPFIFVFNYCIFNLIQSSAAFRGALVSHLEQFYSNSDTNIHI